MWLGDCARQEIGGGSCSLPSSLEQESPRCPLPVSWLPCLPSYFHTGHNAHSTSACLILQGPCLCFPHSTAPVSNPALRRSFVSALKRLPSGRVRGEKRVSWAVPPRCAESRRRGKLCDLTGRTSSASMTSSNTCTTVCRLPTSSNSVPVEKRESSLLRDTICGREYQLGIPRHQVIRS